MATRSSILAWEIPWTKEPGELNVHGAAKESDMIQGLNNNTRFTVKKVTTGNMYFALLHECKNESAVLCWIPALTSQTCCLQKETLWDI